MIEPPTCVPIAAGTMLAPTAAAEPDDEPPGVRLGSNGLVVAPGCEPPSSAVTVLARITAPAWRSAQTRGIVALGEVSLHRRAAHLGGHVLGLEQVLDGDRHAVDQRQRLAGLPALGAGVGGGAGAGLVHRGEGLHHRLARGDGLEAALEIGARAVVAVGEAAGGVVEGERLVVGVAVMSGSLSHSCPLRTRRHGTASHAGGGRTVFAGLNYLAILLAALAAFGWGAIYYMTLSKQWLAAVGMSKEQMQSTLGGALHHLLRRRW